MHTRFLDAVKAFEGFTKQSKWDYAQHTNGFGTKALYPGEKITVTEANRRFAAEIEDAGRFVETQAQGWDEGTKAALTSLTFNAGTRWASDGLGEAIRSRDIDAVRSRFLQYTKAGGEVLPGLVKRRLFEVTWIGEGVAPPPEPRARVPSQPDAPVPTTTQIEAQQARPTASAEQVHPAPDPSALYDRDPLTQARPGEATATETASLVAWMLLALDLGRFDPRQAKDHDSNTHIAT